MTPYRPSIALELMLAGTAVMCVAASATALTTVLIAKGPAAAIALLAPRPKRK